jgi:hypothetical protein
VAFSFDLLGVWRETSKREGENKKAGMGLGIIGQTFGDVDSEELITV